MDHHLTKKILSQEWDYVKIVHKLPEGSGVFAQKKIPPNTPVCNYGGVNLTREQAEHLKRYESKCNYLVEIEMVQKSKKIKTFVNHTDESYSFGKFINHSEIHPSLSPRIMVSEDGKADIIFYSKYEIPSGSQIVWNYGRYFKGVSKCVTGCLLCLQKQCVKRYVYTY